MLKFQNKAEENQGTKEHQTEVKHEQTERPFILRPSKQ